MTTVSRRTLSIPDLRAQLRRQVIAPDDVGYDEGRQVFLPLVDRRPAVIVRPVDAGEVARIVTLARETRARAGPSAAAATAAPATASAREGFVLDLLHMKALAIDPDRRVAWAETGLTSGEVTNAAAEHGSYRQRRKGRT